MKKWFALSVVVIALVLLLSPCTPQAAGTAATPAKAAKPAAAAEQPQPGGIWKIMLKNASNVFGYPPRITGSARDFAVPFFDHLLSVGEGGKYKPELALSWDTSKDGKTITFKLRQGVKFHDGSPFNAQAVKANIDNLIPPAATLLTGITSVEVVDDYTVKVNLAQYNNLTLYHFATNPVTYMYSPEALKSNGVDWAVTHPVGTGPFMLKDYQPNVSLSLVKNPNYWQKGLPYLDGINISIIPDPMTQTLTLKAGQANAIYDSSTAVTDQLRGEGYPLQMAPGSFLAMNFDSKNSKIFANPKVRQAVEYAIDKESICAGPGQGLFKPMYQIVPANSPDYNPACPPRKFDPAKAKKLLAEAGYPKGFSFKLFYLDSSWKDGIVAVQSYLDKVGIKMEINFVNAAAYNQIRASGKIEPGAGAGASFTSFINTLFVLDYAWRTDSTHFGYVVKPAGIDKLIDQAKIAREPAAITKINRQIVKLIYDDESIIPLYYNLRTAVLDKSVRNSGWFLYGDENNNQFGTRTWLKK